MASGRAGTAARLVSAWVPVVLLEVLVLYVSSRPNLQVPQIIPNLDKVAHFLEYLAIGGLLFRALRLTGLSRAWSLPIAFVLAAGLGASDELMQRGVPGRCCDIWDWTADALGAGVGALISRSLEQCIPPRVWSLVAAGTTGERGR